ncbi:MAG: mechanosensitive ion channel family protein [Bacteroidetes bacterium]|jgi:small-conductance mechanosensitive channel|nr:mechanosensitive ion channel family protein [Bacteroidota bacterium]
MSKLCTILLLVLTTFTVPVCAQKAAEAKGEPIVVNQDTLFNLYAGQGLFDTKERADIVSKRINYVVNKLDFNADSLKVKNDSNLSVIAYKSQTLLALTDKDAQFSELNRQELAASYLDILKKKLGIAFESNNIKDLIINVLEAVAVIILLFLLIWGVNKGFRIIRLRLLQNWENRMAKLAQKGAPFRYARQLLPFLNNLIKAARIFIVILLVYIALPVLFMIFPWTKPIANKLLSYVVTPVTDILLAFLHYIPNMLTIAVIYIVTRYIIKLVKFISDEIENGSFTIHNFYPEWALPTYNIIRVLLYAFMFVVIFPYLPGSESKVFQGVTVFVGVLFSFGSSSAISNMVAGIVLTYMRAFKIGDRIQAGNVIGDVFEKNLLLTRIRTIKNEDITIPNSTILNGYTINYTSSSKSLGLILHTTITIGYDAPWQTIHELMTNAALATDGVLHEPKPFVLQTALNDFNVSYQVNAYTSQPHKMAAIYSELHKNIQNRFNEAGVEIMSPHFTALRDGNNIQIPEDYIGKDYRAPGFIFEKDK